MGLRPGCIHVILSTTGAGKSTLVMSLIEEMLDAGKSVFLYSSEESVKDIETKLSYLPNLKNESNLRVYHERWLLEVLANNPDDWEGFLQEINLAMIEMTLTNKPDVLVLDNLTTSLFYDQNKNATRIASGLKSLAEDKNIPIIVVAHTASGVRQNQLFDSSQVRGFRTITNTAQYVYCLIRLRVDMGGMWREVVVEYTEKSRNHSVASRSCYKLFFNVDTKLFSGDEKINYEVFREFLRDNKC